MGKMKKEYYRKKYNYLLFIFCFLLLVFLNLSCDIASGPEVEEYEFNLPSVHVHIDPEDLGTLNSNVYSNKYVPARLVYNNREYKIHLRNQGHFSRHFLKKSYKIEFNDTDLFENRKSIVLSSQWTDKSLLRSRLSFYLFQKAGLMVSENRFITLFFDDNYKGIYYLIETVDEFFFLNRGKEIVTIYEAKGDTNLTFRDGQDVRVEFKKKPIDDGNYSDLEYLINILYTESTDKLPICIEEVLDVENYLNYLAVSALVNNRDGFFKNFHLHKERGGRFKIIPWDLDDTFRNPSENIFGRNNLSKRLLQVETYRLYYKNRLQELMTTEFSEEALFPMMDRLSDYIKEAYENDPFLKAAGGDLEEEISDIKNFIQERRIYIYEELKNF
jgi:spore coat protein H